MSVTIPGIERRQMQRRSPVPNEAVSRVRLRLGPELDVMNVSDCGALLEGKARLSPGTRVDLHVVSAHGRVLVRSTVVRAQVSCLRPDAVVYRAAVRFDQPIEVGSPGNGCP
jgi:hypothetical protein